MKRRLSYRTRQAIIDKLKVTNKSDITPHQVSAIIGLWRMGNPENVISGLFNCEWKDVVSIVKTYQYIS